MTGKTKGASRAHYGKMREKKGVLCHPNWFYWAPTLEVRVVGQPQPKIVTPVPVSLWIVV